MAPALSLLAERYPQLEIRLDLFDRVVDIIDEGFDLEIRVGDDLPGQHIGRRLVSNRRVLCAAPVICNVAVRRKPWTNCSSTIAW